MTGGRLDRERREKERERSGCCNSWKRRALLRDVEAARERDRARL